MRQYKKPSTEIIALGSIYLLNGTTGNDPNRNNDDEDGGTMGNTSFFDDMEQGPKGSLWDD